MVFRPFRSSSITLDIGFITPGSPQIATWQLTSSSRLSGFVLPFAYEKRLATDMTPLQFWRIRLVRLMPLVALATILSALYVAVRSAAHIKIVTYDELSLAAVLGVLNVPFLWASFDIGGPQIFPLNGPQFSLFLELIVNAVWSMLSRSWGPLSH